MASSRKPDFALIVGQQPWGMQIATHIGAPAIASHLITFPDGEMQPVIEGDLSDRAVFVPGSLHSSDSILELMLTLDAAHQAGARQVTAVIPYLAYTRQDRPAARASFAAPKIAQLLETAGADNFILLDLHNPAITGFFRRPVRHLMPVALFRHAWATHGLDLQEMVIIAPDASSVKRALAFCQASGQADPVALLKVRSGPAQCRMSGIAGEVQGRMVMIVDDIVSSGGTLLEAAQTVAAAGATAVYASATHLVTNQILTNLTTAPLNHLFVTNSHPCAQNTQHDKLTVIDAAPLLAQAIAELAGRPVKTAALATPGTKAATHSWFSPAAVE